LDACREAPVAASSLTLNQAAERFLADKQDDLKRSTLARYTYVLKHYILPVFGAVLLSQLTANQISEFLRRLQKNGLSGKSARDVGVLLKSILRYSAKKLDCPSPGMTVELPAYRRKQIDIFYPDEIQRLAQMIMDEPTTTGIGILLTLNTGLRLGELCALQWSDFTGTQNGLLLTVSRSRSIVAGKGVVDGNTKNGHSRQIILSPALRGVLLSYRWRLAQEAARHGRKLSPYLFVNSDGALIHPDTFTKRLRKIYDAIGFPREYHLHTLRHYFVTSLLHCGVDKQTVADLMGHADTGFLERTYCHPQQAQKEQAADSMLTMLRPDGGQIFNLAAVCPPKRPSA